MCLVLPTRPECTQGNFDIFVYENLNPDDTSWTHDYEIWRHGVTRAIKHKGTPLNATAWLESALPATPNFTLPDPQKYDDRSWEHVVYDIALASAVHLAMFFEARAAEASTQDDRAALYGAAAAVYDSLFDRVVFQGHRPVYWHKNAGLAYYNLAGITHDATHKAKMEQHWHAYVDADPDDPQVADIKRVLNSPQP